MNALIISAIFGVIMMFSGIVLKQKTAIRQLAIAGTLLLLVLNILELQGIHLFYVDTRGMMAFDNFALIFDTIAAACTFLFLLLSAKDMEKIGQHYAEYFALLFFVLCGIALTVSFKSLLILFLGIEIISIPLYILTGSDKRNLKSNEASLKYFLLGAFSTGLMLMGIALIYGARGTFASFDINVFTQNKPSLLLMAGMLLMLFAMSFKASAAPFHFWTPDVYDGAPTPITSFMATIVKVGVFVGFIRLFDEAFGFLLPQWKLYVGIIVVSTLFIGNITAVFQQSVKRMLAYSSVAHAGFMMMAIYAMNSDAKEGLLLYAAAYSLATIGIFAVMAKMKDYTYDGFNGFARHQPLLAAAITVCLLSLAGIPLTGGFLAKFFMLKAVLASGHSLWLVIFAVLMAAVSVYYYFRLIQAMYFKEGDAPEIEVSAQFKWTLIVITALIILLGVYPDIISYWLYF